MAVQFSGKFTVWNAYNEEQVIPSQSRGNYTEIQVSTSNKRRGSDTYETDFKARLRFIGNAEEKLLNSNLKAGDRIEVKSGSHTNNYDKAKKITYSNYLVWDFDVIQKENTKQNVEKQSTVEELEPIDDTDLPF